MSTKQPQLEASELESPLERKIRIAAKARKSVKFSVDGNDQVNVNVRAIPNRADEADDDSDDDDPNRSGADRRAMYTNADMSARGEEVPRRLSMRVERKKVAHLSKLDIEIIEKKQWLKILDTTGAALALAVNFCSYNEVYQEFLVSMHVE